MPWSVPDVMLVICPYLHVHQAQDLHTHMSVHLKHFVELAHLEKHGGIKVASLELPPTGVTTHHRPDIDVCHWFATSRYKQLDARCPCQNVSA